MRPHPSESKVADIGRAVDGRRIVNETEGWMRGLIACRNNLSPATPLRGARITGVLHMTAQTAVLIETLSALGADLRWCSSNAFSTQDSVAAAVAKARSASIFAWKGQTPQEYWWCVKKACTWPGGKGPNLILDTGGDLTHLIHVGVDYEISYERTGAPPPHLLGLEPAEESAVILNMLRDQYLRNPAHWRELVQEVVGVCEQTSSGVHRLRQRESNGSLLFPAMSINDCITKSKIENIYGIKHSVLNGLLCALDVMLAGKTVLICGFGDVGMGCAMAMKAAGARCLVAETDPVRALMAGMEGYQVTTIETVLSEVDMFITATGDSGVIRMEHMLKMKKNAVVGNMGHFNREIDMESLRKYPGTKAIEVKPNVQRWTFQDGHSITLLAEGRLLNLICGTGNPSLVMSIAFTLQVLTQAHLWKNRNLAQTLPTVCVPPRKIDTQAALYHLPCIGAELTVSTNNPISSNEVL
ncbi:Adenosylhomocysteinase [Gracilariopsis chorda]|uniref:adenosylhomocysteinase n=1 Tax=Gracilariopsis chorda TaxID=448386 RepID=A0A2V3IJ55_9FLOR|nr:Adenosylhomocysteinase [Gracilariopsis chorda]|eukprot:PXF42135.1 Adenosylhomocysteinase [Gracilariopsis chorda]